MDSRHSVKIISRNTQVTLSHHQEYLALQLKVYSANISIKLDACNYVTARCAHLVQQTVSTHHSGVGYRDQSLTTMQLPLKKESQAS